MNLFGFINLQDWWIFIIFLATIIYIYSTWTVGYLELNGIATETPIPIFGNLWQLIRQPMHLVDMTNYRTLGKVHGFYEGSAPTLVIGDIELIKAVLVKNFNHFTDRRRINVGPRLKVMDKFLTALTGEEWKIARHILTPAFSPTKLQQIEQHMEEFAKELSKNLNEEIMTAANGKDIDVKSLLSSHIINAIASAVFGVRVDCSNKDKFCFHATKISNQDTSVKFILSSLAPRWFSMFGLDLFPPNSISYFFDLAEKIVEQRMANNTKNSDFLQLLIDARIEGNQKDNSECESTSSEDHFHVGLDQSQTPSINFGNYNKVLTHESIAAQSVSFLIAGLNTMVTTMSLALYYLALNPDWQNKLHTEIDSTRNKNNGILRNDDIYEMNTLNMIISEVLRLHPPATRLERICTNNCTLGNINVKKGMLVAVPIYAIHHDEQHFPDPEKFNPDRFDLKNKAVIKSFTYMPFGAGYRNCIGMKYSLMQMKIGLANILSETTVAMCEMTKVPVQTRLVNGILVPTNGIILRLSKRLHLTK